jgi:hypothetical protein
VWVRDPEAYAAFRMTSKFKQFVLPKTPDRFAGWMRRTFGWQGFTAIGAVMYAVVTLSLCLSMVVAVEKAARVMKGGGHEVRVTLAGTSAPLPGMARMLGTVGDFVFLYWPESRKAEAVSIESATRIESVVSAHFVKAAPTSQTNTAR